MDDVGERGTGRSTAKPRLLDGSGSGVVLRPVDGSVVDVVESTESGTDRAAT